MYPSNFEHKISVIENLLQMLMSKTMVFELQPRSWQCTCVRAVSQGRSRSTPRGVVVSYLCVYESKKLERKRKPQKIAKKIEQRRAWVVVHMHVLQLDLYVCTLRLQTKMRALPWEPTLQESSTGDSSDARIQAHTNHVQVA